MRFRRRWRLRAASCAAPASRRAIAWRCSARTRRTGSRSTSRSWPRARSASRSMRARRRASSPACSAIARPCCCSPRATRSPSAIRAAWPEHARVALYAEAFAGSAVGARDPPAARQPVTIIYTSGTSGEPKGVLLDAGQHRLHARRHRARAVARCRVTGRDEDRVFHYLPFCFAGLADHAVQPAAPRQPADAQHRPDATCSRRCRPPRRTTA